MSSQFFLRRVGFVLTHCIKEVLVFCATGICILLILVLSSPFVILNKMLSFILTPTTGQTMMIDVPYSCWKFIVVLHFASLDKIVFYWYESGGDVDEYFAPGLKQLICQQQTFSIIEMETKIQKPSVYQFRRHFENVVLCDAKTNKEETNIHLNHRINIAHMFGRHMPTTYMHFHELYYFINSDWHCILHSNGTYYQICCVLYPDEKNNCFNMHFNSTHYQISFCDLHSVLK